MNNDTHTESEKSTKFSTKIYPYITVDVVDIKLITYVKHELYIKNPAWRPVKLN